jgi:hypothetical protein
MSGRYTFLVAFLAGILGGTLPWLFFAEQVAFAQKPTPATKVIRAERIELVNNHGKAVAVFDVSYSEASPAGQPTLTFMDRDEASHKDRKVVLTTTQFRIQNGEDEWSYLEPGSGLTFKTAAGGGAIGVTKMPELPPTIKPGITIYGSSGLVELTGQNLVFSDKDGVPRLVVPR